jgi:predicted nucleotidyltransferase
MRFNNVLEDILGKRSNVSILRVLADKNAELTGRRIAVLTGLNHRTCLLSLEGLQRQGFITRRSVGSANLYRLKRENFLIEQGILPLLKLEKGLIISMIAPVLDIIEKEARPHVQSVVLFGSVARAEEEPDSDIDLCLILDEQGLKERISTLLEPVREHIIRAFGNNLSIHMLTVQELKERYARNDSIIKEIMESKYVWGEQVARLLTQRA